jgi:hypothetical protein
MIGFYYARTNLPYLLMKLLVVCMNHTLKKNYLHFYNINLYHIFHVMLIIIIIFFTNLLLAIRQD